MGGCLSGSEVPPSARRSLDEAIQNFPIPPGVQSRLTDLSVHGVDAQKAAECASQAIQLFNTSKAAGRVIPKDELRAIYSHVDSDLFDYIFRFIDWESKKIKAVQEFIVAITAMSSSVLKVDEQLEIIFAVCDKDKNGVLDKEEFERFMKLNLSMKLVHLSVLLATKPGKMHLTQHLKEEFSEENIIFYTDVVDYEKSYNPATANERAASIVETYIQSNARLQVNLSAKVQKEVLTHYQACLDAGEIIPADIFKQAKMEVFDLMEHDTFERFRQNETEIDAMIQDFFNEIDVDKNGTISLQEFRAWMTKNPGALEILDRMGADTSEAVSTLQQMQEIEKQAIARLSAHVLARKQSLSQLRRQSEAPNEASARQELEELKEMEGADRVDAGETNDSERRTTPKAQETLHALEIAEGGPTDSEAD